MPEPASEAGLLTVSHTAAVAAADGPVTRVVGAGKDGEGNTHASDLGYKTAGKHITAISAGQNHALALTDDGHIIGAGPDRQQLADLSTQAADKRITAIAAGDSHSLAVTDDGHIIAAAGEQYHEAGDSYKKCISELLSQTKGKRVTAIAAAWFSSLALTDDGQVIGAGAGLWDQAPSLADMAKGKRVTAVANAWYRSFALTDDGQVIGAGDDKYRALSGLLSQAKGKRIIAVSSGQWHSLALTDDGQVIGAGKEYCGEITKLIAETAGKRVTAIAAGKVYSLALTAEGQVIAVGDNEHEVVSELKHKTQGKKATAITAGDTCALALVKQPPRMMAGQATVAGLPQATAPNELGASGSRPSAAPASQHTSLTSDSLKKGENQSIQISQGESSITTILSGGVRTVHGTVTAATAQAGTNAPLVAALTAMSLDVTVTSTNDEAPSPTVHLKFNAITINGQQQPTAPAPNTTLALDNGGKAVLNRQQPNDTGIDVTAVALFDHSGHEVMRLGHISAHLPIAT